MLRWWTIGVASGIGFSAEFVALFLWPIAANAAPHIFFWPFLAAVLIAAFCALSILVLTARDMAVNKRGERVRAIRIFDLVFAIIVVGLTVLQLQPFAPYFLS
jgi:Mn2+/Fe2+ NRAMP family transporter